MTRLGTAAWGLVAAVVIAAWIPGHFAWGRVEDPARYDFTWAWTAVPMVLFGLPLVILAGFLVASGRPKLGYLALAVAGCVLAYLAWFSHFGGFCIDPGDACMITWRARVGTLLAGLLILAAGLFVQHRLRRRYSSRSTGSVPSSGPASRSGLGSP